MRKNLLKIAIIKLTASILKSTLFDSAFDRMYPDLSQRIHLNNFFDDLIQTVKSGTDQHPYSTYESTNHVYRAIKVWQDLIASVESINVRNKKNEILENKVVDKLLSVPNPDMSACEVWHIWALQMGLHGEIGFEVVYDGLTPVELWPHSPENIFVRKDEKAQIYNRVQSYRIKKEKIADYELEKNEMIFWKFYNPKNPYRGIAPIRAIREATIIDQLALAWNRAFFKNQARPDFIIFSKEGLTPRERESMENSLAKKFGMAGTKNNWGIGKPLVLEKEISDIKQIGFAPADLQWINARKMTRDDIGSVFGIPRELMFSDVAKYENLAQAQMLTWVMTIVPLLKLRDDKLTHFFRSIDVIKFDQHIQTDLSRVWPLRITMEAVFQQAKDLFGMGVPFAFINKFFGFGIDEFASDMNSHPTGTRSSFDKDGDVIDTGRDFEIGGES